MKGENLNPSDESSGPSRRAQAEEEDLFQSIINKCAPDDKHRIRRRLHGLLKYIDSRLKDIYSPALDLSNK